MHDEAEALAAHVPRAAVRDLIGGGWVGYLSYPDPGADGRPNRIPEAAGGWTDCVLRRDRYAQWWYESLSGAAMPDWLAGALAAPLQRTHVGWDIEWDTADRWCARAVAAYEFYTATRELRWLSDAIAYHGEAVEHAAHAGHAARVGKMAPTCVHGGIIAALFDEVMGAANLLGEHPGMTGTLTVRYRRPTPLLAPLGIVARFTGSERRKVFTWAGLYHDGALTAEAEGIFITMEPNRLLDIAATNALASDEQVIDHDFAQLIAKNAGS